MNTWWWWWWIPGKTINPTSIYKHWKAFCILECNRARPHPPELLFYTSMFVGWLPRVMQVPLATELWPELHTRWGFFHSSKLGESAAGQLPCLCPTRTQLEEVWASWVQFPDFSIMWWKWFTGVEPTPYVMLCYAMLSHLASFSFPLHPRRKCGGVVHMSCQV